VIGKLCAAPKGGGSAGGLVEYLVGYAVAEKGASKEEIRDALEGVFLEAESRADLGAGAMWKPEAGHGTRPSSILVRNCDSMSTAALEMDSDALVNPAVRNGAMHFVWSFSESETAKLSDEQVHAYVGEVLTKLGLADHRSLAVVHRDTENIHVHCAVGAVHPETGIAYDRTSLYKRMAWAEREVELAHGLEHDHGLAVVRDAGTPEQRIDWADKHELAAWRAQRREERLLRQERRSFEGYRERDVTFERYVDATVAPRLRAAIDTAAERGRASSWGDLHATAARYGVAIQEDDTGRVILRDVGIAAMKFEHRREMLELRRNLKGQNIEPDEIDKQITELKAKHAKAEIEERTRKEIEGETELLDGYLYEDAVDRLGMFQTAEESELHVAAQVAEDPHLVLADVTAQSSTFSREDIDAWLCARISDPEEIERLGDLVMRDESIRVLSADTIQPLCTTTEILEIEDRLADDARVLAATDSGITKEQITRAMATYEAEQSEKNGKTFHLNEEQKNALLGISRGSLLSIEGLPGTGKTTVMGVVRVLGEQTDREVVGITLSQAAAERLESEAGFKCVNSSRAAIIEEGGKEQIIPTRGIVVVDEAAMMDSRANGKIVALARERGCLVQEIYDTRQLQPIDFGASARIIRDVANSAGTHAELRDVQRQKNAWHREAVVTMADAIIEKDEMKRLALVKESLAKIEAHGAITWVKNRDEAIDEAVKTHRINKAFGQADSLLIAADKDTVRHLAEEDRRRGGFEGRGMRFVTEGGERELCVGDEFVFLENSQGRRGIGVLNGNRGIVTDVARDRIEVELHDGRTVAFSPRGYKAWDHGNALSVHKSQGASVSTSTSIIDPSASAELVFVAMSRSKEKLNLVVAESNFKNTDELAEHISGRISLKTTSRNYDEIIERTGGKDTLRVIHMEREEAVKNSPLRRKWEAEVKEPALAIRAERVRELREVYAAKKEEIGKDRMLSLSDRLSQERVALKEFRTSVADVHRETQPLKYKDYKAELDRAHDLARDIERSISQRREQEREKHHERDLQHAADRRYDPRRHEHEIEQGYEHER